MTYSSQIKHIKRILKYINSHPKYKVEFNLSNKHYIIIDEFNQLRIIHTCQLFQRCNLFKELNKFIYMTRPDYSMKILEYLQKNEPGHFQQFTNKLEDVYLQLL